jgi:RNA polymerase sigma-70 factor (ECF subfamily)
MRNIFINNYRRKSKQQTVFDNSANDFLIDSKQTVIANDAIANLQMKEIQQALHQLPDIFKNPFLLYF